MHHRHRCATARLQPVPSRAPLIGRDQEVTTIVDLPRRPSVPLMTLTGPAGSDKTRLALHVAADLQPRFAHGVRVPTFALRDGLIQRGSSPTGTHVLVLRDAAAANNRDT